MSTAIAVNPGSSRSASPASRARRGRPSEASNATRRAESKDSVCVGLVKALGEQPLGVLSVAQRPEKVAQSGDDDHCPSLLVGLGAGEAGEDCIRFVTTAEPGKRECQSELRLESTPGVDSRTCQPLPQVEIEQPYSLMSCHK